MTRFLSLYLTAIFVLVGCRIDDEDCPAIYAPVCGQDGVTYETTVTREMLVLHNGHMVDVIVLRNQKYLMSPAMKLLHQFVDVME